MRITPTLVRDAHADAWQVEGRIRRPYGGDAIELPGARLMCSGLAHPQWNSGDVLEPDLVDLDAVGHWYATRAVRWGLRLPAGAAWPHGRLILTRSLMGLTLDKAVEPAAAPGLVLRIATPDDLEMVLAVDSAAFGSDPAEEGPWSLPHLVDDQVEVVLAVVDDVPVATGYGVRSEGRAGPAVHVGGVCVRPSWEGRGIGTALTRHLLSAAAASGVRLAHLEPETERARSVYRRIGFVEVPGHDIYVDHASPA